MFLFRDIGVKLMGYSLVTIYMPFKSSTSLLLNSLSVLPFLSLSPFSPFLSPTMQLNSCVLFTFQSSHFISFFLFIDPFIFSPVLHPIFPPLTPLALSEKCLHEVKLMVLICVYVSVCLCVCTCVLSVPY